MKLSLRSEEYAMGKKEKSPCPFPPCRIFSPILAAVFSLPWDRLIFWIEYSLFFKSLSDFHPYVMYFIPSA